MERLWAQFPVQTEVVKMLDSRWRGCGLDSQFRQNPPYPQPITTLQQQCFSSGCPISSHLKVTLLQTKIWNQSHNCLGHNPWPWWQLLGIKNRLRKKIHAFAWNKNRLRKINLCIHMKSRTDSEFEKENLCIHMESRTDSEFEKENLCIRMESRTDSERKSLHSHGIKNRLRKSMHLHSIKNRLRKKINAFTWNQEQTQKENQCIHMESRTDSRRISMHLHACTCHQAQQVVNLLLLPLK